MSNTTTTTFSKSWINILLYTGIIGAVISILPLVLPIDNDLSSESILDIGDTLTTVAEIGFISLLAFKFRNDGIERPSYMLLSCYAGVLTFALLVGFLNEDIGFIMGIISIIFSIVIGIILITVPYTKKIGMWLLLSMAGFILLLAIVLDDFENSQKVVGIILAMLYVYPFAKYMESFQKLLADSSSEDNSDDNDLIKKYEKYKAEQAPKDNRN